jgi:hypothetical protein
VEVLFDEPVEASSAQNIHNYTINNNITVLQADLMDDLLTVHLTTSEHMIDVTYTISIEHVRDRSTRQNAIASPVTETYTGTSGPLDIWISCDDEYELYVNGEFVGSNSGWSTAEHYSVPSIAGKNLLAVKCVDQGGQAGFVAEIDFEGEHLVSNENWKVSTAEESGWETIPYDDLIWNKATSFGTHGEALPWAQYKNVEGISTNRDAQWIWSSDNDYDNVVYLRFSLRSSGDSTPPSAPTGVVVSKQ